MCEAAWIMASLIPGTPGRAPQAPRFGRNRQQPALAGLSPQNRPCGSTFAVNARGVEAPQDRPPARAQ